MTLQDRATFCLEHGIDLVKRTTWLKGDVDDDMLELVSQSLHLFEGKPAHFYLNSEGGDEQCGLGICDLIRRYPGTVTITVVGQAESMAAVILQAADRRHITQTSFLMFHQGTLQPPEGHKKNIRAYLKLSETLGDICDQIVLARIQKKRPKHTWAQFQNETDFDQYFSAEQALRWNLVDRIVR
jgi:ATP-dependent Clp protease protease subunit